MRLGIFGGTFDPPHVGHLIVAEDVAAALRLDGVVFVPVGEHPLKGTRVEAPAALRLQMIAAAVKDNERFSVDDREVRRDGPSYTVDTLAEVDPGDSAAAGFRRVEVTHVAISSSEVRDRVRAGRPYRYLVPAAVYRIIEENSLYRRRD